MRDLMCSKMRFASFKKGGSSLGTFVLEAARKNHERANFGAHHVGCDADAYDYGGQHQTRPRPTVSRTPARLLPNAAPRRVSTGGTFLESPPALPGRAIR